MKYRAEIDGLRALAVVPVILYHAGFSLFSGGFVGVDVFFVISGYLITTILLDDLENKTFSIKKFYEKRIRRILPALFLVMLVSVVFAYCFMIPVAMKDFSKSLIAVCLFISNIFFWKTTGYFETTAEEKPLLHTWSLAVEEQYYMFFPILLFLLWRFGKNRVFWTITALAAISFFFSELVLRKQDVLANFYLAPPRAWEIFAGSIAAFLIKKKDFQESNLYSLLGFVLILYSIFCFNEATPFPSAYTLVPVIGTVLLIIYGSQQTIIARFLSLPIFVGIGLISYSAYLWHQPILVFSRTLFYNLDKNTFLLIALIALSFLLAFLSWKFVEKPFRDPSKISKKQLIISLGSVFVILLSLGIIGKATNGLKTIMYKYKFTAKQGLVIDSLNSKLIDNMAVTDCHIWVKNSKELDAKQLALCEQKYGKALVVLGDSHAMNLFNIISYNNSYPFMIGVSQGGCRPHSNFEHCQYKEFMSFLPKHKNLIAKVLYHQSGSYFVVDTRSKVDSQKSFQGNFAGFQTAYIKTILKYLDYLKQSVRDADIEIVWLGPFLEYRKIPRNLLYSDEVATVNSESIKIFASLEKVLANEASKVSSIKYFAFKKFFMQPEQAFVDDCFMFSNKDHYALCAEKIIGASAQPRFLDLESDKGTDSKPHFEF